MSKILILQTNDEEKLLRLEKLYVVQGYFTFRLRVCSGPYHGVSHFCVSSDHLQAFAEEIGHLNDTLQGKAELNDYDSDAFIIFESTGYGQITIKGQVGGTHQDHFMKFKFKTDQTTLDPFRKQIHELLKVSRDDEL